MSMLLDCLQELKNDLNNKEWNQIPVENYQIKYNELSSYIENWKNDKWLEKAKSIVDELKILMSVNGEFFVGQYYDKLDEEKKKAFDKLKDLLRDIEI